MLTFLQTYEQLCVWMCSQKRKCLKIHIFPQPRVHRSTPVPRLIVIHLQWNTHGFKLSSMKYRKKKTHNWNINSKENSGQMKRFSGELMQGYHSIVTYVVCKRRAEEAGRAPSLKGENKNSCPITKGKSVSQLFDHIPSNKRHNNQIKLQYIQLQAGCNKKAEHPPEDPFTHTRTHTLFAKWVQGHSAHKTVDWLTNAMTLYYNHAKPAEYLPKLNGQNKFHIPSNTRRIEIK